jgi:hypothetical protein
MTTKKIIIVLLIAIVIFLLYLNNRREKERKCIVDKNYSQNDMRIIQKPIETVRENFLTNSNDILMEKIKLFVPGYCQYVTDVLSIMGPAFVNNINVNTGDHGLIMTFWDNNFAYGYYTNVNKNIIVDTIYSSDTTNPQIFKVVLSAQITTVLASQPIMNNILLSRGTLRGRIDDTPCLIPINDEGFISIEWLNTATDVYGHNLCYYSSKAQSVYNIFSSDPTIIFTLNNNIICIGTGNSVNNLVGNWTFLSIITTKPYMFGTQTINNACTNIYNGDQGFISATWTYDNSTTGNALAYYSYPNNLVNIFSTEPNTTYFQSVTQHTQPQIMLANNLIDSSIDNNIKYNWSKMTANTTGATTNNMVVKITYNTDGSMIVFVNGIFGDGGTNNPKGNFYSLPGYNTGGMGGFVDPTKGRIPDAACNDPTCPNLRVDLGRLSWCDNLPQWPWDIKVCSATVSCYNSEYEVAGLCYHCNPSDTGTRVVNGFCYDNDYIIPYIGQSNIYYISGNMFIQLPPITLNLAPLAPNPTVPNFLSECNIPFPLSLNIIPINATSCTLVVKSGLISTTLNDIFISLPPWPFNTKISATLSLTLDIELPVIIIDPTTTTAPENAILLAEIYTQAYYLPIPPQYMGDNYAFIFSLVAIKTMILATLNTVLAAAPTLFKFLPQNIINQITNGISSAINTVSNIPNTINLFKIDPLTAYLIALLKDKINFVVNSSSEDLFYYGWTSASPLTFLLNSILSNPAMFDLIKVIALSQLLPIAQNEIFKAIGVQGFPLIFLSCDSGSCATDLTLFTNLFNYILNVQSQYTQTTPSNLNIIQALFQQPDTSSGTEDEITCGVINPSALDARNNINQRLYSWFKRNTMIPNIVLFNNVSNFTAQILGLFQTAYSSSNPTKNINNLQLNTYPFIGSNESASGLIQYAQSLDFLQQYVQGGVRYFDCNIGYQIDLSTFKGPLSFYYGTGLLKIFINSISNNTSFGQLIQKAITDKSTIILSFRDPGSFLPLTLPTPLPPQLQPIKFGDLSQPLALNYTGYIQKIQIYYVPVFGHTEIEFSCWGGGGGGGGMVADDIGVYPTPKQAAPGGGGAFISGKFSVKFGDILEAIVGQGGLSNNTQGLKIFGGGGAGGIVNNFFNQPPYLSSCGGGYSGIILNGKIILIVAGGGGIPVITNVYQNPNPGTASTTQIPNTGGGSILYNGVDAGTSGGGGGGGGGYYGGYAGGGDNWSGLPGNGGISYIDTTVITVYKQIDGNLNNAGGQDQPYYIPGIGVGGASLPQPSLANMYGASGGNGLVVFNVPKSENNYSDNSYITQPPESHASLSFVESDLANYLNNNKWLNNTFFIDNQTRLNYPVSFFQSINANIIAIIDNQYINQNINDTIVCYPGTDPNPEQIIVGIQLNNTNRNMEYIYYDFENIRQSNVTPSEVGIQPPNLIDISFSNGEVYALDNIGQIWYNKNYRDTNMENSTTYGWVNIPYNSISIGTGYPIKICFDGINNTLALIGPNVPMTNPPPNTTCPYVNVFFFANQLNTTFINFKFMGNMAYGIQSFSFSNNQFFAISCDGTLYYGNSSPTLYQVLGPGKPISVAYDGYNNIVTIISIIDITNNVKQSFYAMGPTIYTNHSASSPASLPNWTTVLITELPMSKLYLSNGSLCITDINNVTYLTPSLMSSIWYTQTQINLECLSYYSNVPIPIEIIYSLNSPKPPTVNKTINYLVSNFPRIISSIKNIKMINLTSNTFKGQNGKCIPCSAIYRKQICNPSAGFTLGVLSGLDNIEIKYKSGSINNNIVNITLDHCLLNIKHEGGKAWGSATRFEIPCNSKWTNNIPTTQNVLLPTKTISTNFTIKIQVPISTNNILDFKNSILSITNLNINLFNPKEILPAIKDLDIARGINLQIRNIIRNKFSKNLLRQLGSIKL